MSAAGDGIVFGTPALLESARDFEHGLAGTVDGYPGNQDWVQRVLGGSCRLERTGTIA